MSRLIMICAVLAGCVEANVVECGDGLVCPSETTCRLLTNPDEAVCATQHQLDECIDKAAFDACALDETTMGRCYDGVCSPTGCGNWRIDPDEQCDDGNTASRDGCRADCASTEICGNGQIDPLESETCDDGNLLDSDGCTSACATETLHWVQHFNRPPARRRGGAAYDARRDRIVLFGGEHVENMAFKYPGTWEGSGVDWTRFPGQAPTSRSLVGMAFDGRAVLMRSGNENWLFDGTSWERTAGTDALGNRFYQMMAYDARRDRVVLFGGTAATSETWEWDGATRTWTSVATAATPPPRNSGLMAYDPARGVIVMVGGSANFNGPALTDTWTYDGVNWTNATPSTGAVPQLMFGGLAWDPGSKRLITFGGCNAFPCNAGSVVSATLAWNGTTWTDLGLTGPTGRYDYQMVGTSERLYMLGGAFADNTSTDEVWVFENGGWSQPIEPGPMAVVACNELARDRITMFDYLTPSTWLLDENGWTEVAGTQPPTGSARMTYNPITKTCLLLHYPGGQTWEWNGTQWTDRAPAQTLPSNRIDMAMAFDGIHITAFGGLTPGVGPSNETYIWSGSTWQLVTPAHSPPARISPSIGYDPIRKHLVLFGGVSPILGRLDDLWTFDGTDWTERPITARPSALAGPMTWNPARQRLMLGLWEWDGATWSISGTADTGPTYPLANATTTNGRGTIVLSPDYWELTWIGNGTHERCDGNDLDGDEKNRCDDPDCWTACEPLCPPSTSCGVGDPTCGNGTCDSPFETCRSCPMDCTCAPTCGDGICDPGETGCPGDC